MKYYPPIQIGDDEVIGVNLVTKKIYCNIFTDFKSQHGPTFRPTKKQREEIDRRCRRTALYMFDEGFIPDDDAQWNVIAKVYPLNPTTIHDSYEE